MTFPFKLEKERKYQCFVCGLLFDDFNDYKEHIVVKHEEEKDYVLCPYDTCGAPVRDLKAHWKVKHRYTPMPTNIGATRAVVWRDKNEKKGKRKKRNKFRTGTFTSLKNKKDFQYRSGLECELFEILETTEVVKKYDYEVIKIPYYYKGERHTYNPDYIVLYEDDSKEIIECKPSNQTNSELNKAKWDAAEVWCKERGWGFSVVTEIGIRKLQKKLNIKRK